MVLYCFFYTFPAIRKHKSTLAGISFFHSIFYSTWLANTLRITAIAHGKRKFCPRYIPTHPFSCFFRYTVRQQETMERQKNVSRSVGAPEPGGKLLAFGGLGNNARAFPFCCCCINSPTTGAFHSTTVPSSLQPTPLHTYTQHSTLQYI